MKIFKPTRKNLHPKIVRNMERIRRWHIKNGYKPSYNLDSILKNFVGIKAGSFTILIQDAGVKYHGNVGIDVYNENGMMVDVRIYYNPVNSKRVPKKAFIGTPIINGSKSMQYRPLRRQDTTFRPY